AMQCLLTSRPPSLNFRGLMLSMVSVGTCAEKVAVTVVSAAMSIVHGPSPEQPPHQPANVDPDLAAALSEIVVPSAYVCAQLGEQLIPLPVTDPWPVPASATDSMCPDTNDDTVPTPLASDGLPTSAELGVIGRAPIH